MKTLCRILILLGGVIACKNSAAKAETMKEVSEQVPLEVSQHDSIVPSDEDRPQGGKEEEKYYLHKDSLKGELFDVLTNDKQRKRLKENQIELLTKGSAPYEQSSGDYEECKDWSISEKTIKYVMKHSKMIDFRELHDMFDVYPCVVEGELTYKGESYFYRVNAGSWWELTQGEKYLMMGYYGDDAIKRGFINGVYDWSSVQ